VEDFSVSAIKSLILANQMLSAGILSLLVTSILAWAYWERVGYFVMRVWHGVPIIGTVASYAGKEPVIQANGWTDVETNLSRAYLTEYNKVNKSADYFRQCQDYLMKIGEAGRKPRPLWVLLLAVVLVIIEAVGFGYVLSGFMSMDASASDKRIMAACTAILLAIVSCVFAEMAGHAFHHNSLIKKARLWWQGDDPDTRSRQLKQTKSLNVEDSFDDNGGKDYEQILARIATNGEVMPKRTAIVACFVIVVLMAVGAFVIRAKTLESIESEMVNSLRLDSTSSSATSSASPFELPSDSQDINSAADEQSIDDKMQAIKEGSFTTYLILSAIYVAIQGVTIWLAAIFGFAGVHSRRAWEYTHRFNTADEMCVWMEHKRTEIAGHADHKLNMLQQKMSTRITTNSKVLENLKGSAVHKRDFLAFVLSQAQRSASHKSELGNAAVAAPVVVAPVVTEQRVEVAAVLVSEVPVIAAASAPVAEVVLPVTPPAAVIAPAAPVQAAVDAGSFHDISELSDEQLVTASKAFKQDVSVLTDIREQQVLLKQMGLFKREDAPA
jgi:hypothetical protein